MIAGEYFKLLLICFIIAFILGLVIVLINGEKFIDILVLTWILIIALVPEGLVVTLIFALSSTQERLDKKFVLTKNLESIEMIGATNCICIDKSVLVD